MNINFGIAPALAATILAATAVAAANPYPQGTVVEGQLQFGRVHIPLPEGQWTVSGSMEWRSGAYEEFYFQLVQTEGDRVTGYIQGGTNPSTSLGTTWYVNNDCARHDMHYVNKKANYPRKQDCAWVNHFEMTFDSSREAARQTVEWLKSHGLKMPLAMLSTGYRLADNSRYLDIDYLHSPLESGFPPAVTAAWESSDWHPSRVIGQPDRSAFIERLKGWVEGNWHRVREGFQGNAVQPLTPMLGTAVSSSAVTSGGSGLTLSPSHSGSGMQPAIASDAASQKTLNITERLKILEGLRAQNLISEQEYQIKREEVLRQF